MPIDWEQFERDVDAAVERSAEKTDDRLAGRISSVTRLTDEEIKDLFPDPADAKKLAELMKIVHGAQERNDKIIQIVDNAERFAAITLTLMQKFS